MTARFDGKVAVVIGAAGGIGAVTARRLASEGAAVALVDLTAPQDQTDQIVSGGGSAVPTCVTSPTGPASRPCSRRSSPTWAACTS